MPLRHGRVRVPAVDYSQLQPRGAPLLQPATAGGPEPWREALAYRAQLAHRRARSCIAGGEVQRCLGSTVARQRLCHLVSGLARSDQL